MLGVPLVRVGDPGEGLLSSAGEHIDRRSAGPKGHRSGSGGPCGHGPSRETTPRCHGTRTIRPWSPRLSIAWQAPAASSNCATVWTRAGRSPVVTRASNRERSAPSGWANPTSTAMPRSWGGREAGFTPTKRPPSRTARRALRRCGCAGCNGEAGNWLHRPPGFPGPRPVGGGKDRSDSGGSGASASTDAVRESLNRVASAPCRRRWSG